MEILRKIRKFTMEISIEDFNKMFVKSTYENSYKRIFENYSINRD
jgi:hypothetical protein